VVSGEVGGEKSIVGEEFVASNDEESVGDMDGRIE
jgi:hypothetical protein